MSHISELPVIQEAIGSFASPKPISRHRYVVTIDDRIECAHQLNLPYESKCNRPHGHTYRIRVTIGSLHLNSDGMVVDFSQIKSIIREYDHRDLNVYVKPSTAEAFAELLLETISERLKPLNPDAQVLEVGVGETQTTMVMVQYASEHR